MGRKTDVRKMAAPAYLRASTEFFLPLASATFIERLLSYHEEDNIDRSAGRKGGRHGRRT
jgi:hypothetical protein